MGHAPCDAGRLVIQSPFEFLFREFPLPGPTDPKDVDQCQKIVECGIVFRSDRNAAVERFDGGPLSGAVGIRPDGYRRIVAGYLPCHRRRGPSGWDSAGEFAELRRKGIRHSGNQKLLQCFPTRTAGLWVQ